MTIRIKAQIYKEKKDIIFRTYRSFNITRIYIVKRMSKMPIYGARKRDKSQITVRSEVSLSHYKLLKTLLYGVWGVT